MCNTMYHRPSNKARHYAALEVLRAIEREDFRFKGLYGYSLEVPRVSVMCVDVDTDVDPIEGTSEFVLGYEHAKLLAIARAYASYSNLKMRQYLETHNGFECSS